MIQHEKRLLYRYDVQTRTVFHLPDLRTCHRALQHIYGRVDAPRRRSLVIRNLETRQETKRTKMKMRTSTNGRQYKSCKYILWQFGNQDTKDLRHCNQEICMTNGNKNKIKEERRVSVEGSSRNMTTNRRISAVNLLIARKNSSGQLLLLLFINKSFDSNFIQIF